jgi:hypothetical protein
MRRKNNDNKQNGWNCFDVAVGIERASLVKFALDHKHDLLFRQLLAPEIRHATALTVVCMNLQEETVNEQNPRLIELFQIRAALELDDDWDKLSVETQIDKLLSKRKEAIDFPRGSLPESMRTNELRELVNNYQQAHEKMREAVAECNTALGHLQGKRWSLAKLDRSFKEEANRSKHKNAYKNFQEARDKDFTPYEKALQDYCESEQTYQQYIEGYYNKKGWVAFQRSFSGEKNSSIVDIAAKMLSAQIIIYQLGENGCEIIYQTAPYPGGEIKLVEFKDNNHFVELDNNALEKKSDGGEKEMSDRGQVSISNEKFPSPPGKAPLLPTAVAGSVYQVKILMLYALEAARSKKPFHLYTEARGFGKFDDCVLYREDKMQVIQVKHSYDPKGEYLLGHLIGPSGEEDKKCKKGKKNNKKATLSKYFDSWMIIESRRENNPKRDEKAIEYLFITNHNLNVTEGLNGLYNESTHTFYKCLSPEPLDDEKQENARKAILKSIYIHLKKVQDGIKQECKKFVDFFDIDLIEEINDNLKAIHIKTTDEKNKKTEKKKKEFTILMALLRKYQCIERCSEKSPDSRTDLYKFTERFISKSNSDKLPPVIQYLRDLFFAKEKVNDESIWEEIRFYTAESNFYDLTNLNRDSSSVAVALGIGYLGPVESNLFKCDLTDIEALLSQEVPKGVHDFFMQFKFKVAQPNVDEITKVLEKEIEEHFDIADSRGIYLPFFFEEMLGYLISKSNEPFTDKKIHEVFEEARKVIDFTRLIGCGQRYEHSIRQANDIKLEEQDTPHLIDNFLDEEKKNIMVCYGQSDMLVAMTICHELQILRDRSLRRDGSYAMIDDKLIMPDKDKEFFKAKKIILLIIDHAMKLSDKQLRDFIIVARDNNKKLLLLTSDRKSLADRIEEISEEKLDEEIFKEIEPLSKDIIKRNIESKVKPGDGVIIGHRFISFSEMQQMGNYYKVMSNPYHLSVMLKQSRARPNITNQSERLFVKPTLIFQKPLYRIEAGLDSKRNIIHFDEADLSSIEQVLELDLAECSKYEGKSLGEIIENFSKKGTNGLSLMSLVFCIKKAGNWHELEDKLQEELKAFHKLIFIGEEVPFDSTPLKLIKSDKKTQDDKPYYELADEADFQYMPETLVYVSYAEKIYDETLVTRLKYPCKRIILSDYGSGKTYLTEEVLREEETTFNWIIRLPMKTLNEDMIEWSLAKLAEHYFGILNEWQRDLLQYDIESGDILWVLDGFDEMSSDKRDNLKQLIDKLVSQPNCLVTSRPSAANFIPLQPDQFIVIKPFDEKQIHQFVCDFFRGKENLKQKTKDLIETWQRKNSMSLLGKPLMCRMACEIIDSSDLDDTELSDITLAQLFDYFMWENFRKYHHVHNGVFMSRLTRERTFRLSSEMLTRLKQAAYAKLFPKYVEYNLSPDESLYNDIERLGFISRVESFSATDAVDYIFDHQTQIEYFAALYWVEQLLKVPKEERIEYVKNVWSDELFNIELEVVWQFVAGIVSTADNIFLKGNGLEAFDAFCAFLLESSEDLVGKVHQDLLDCCYRNMQKCTLQNSSYHHDFAKAISEECKPHERDGDNEDAIGKVKEYTMQNRISQSDKQIVVEYAYASPYSIKNYLDDSLSSDEMKNRIKAVLDNQHGYILGELPLIKKYFEKVSSDKDFAMRIKDEMLAIYENRGGNSDECRMAYAMLVFMLDRKLIKLEDCVESFTKNFNQKNCVLDVVRRLKQKSLLLDEHIKILFTLGRERFWDCDAGIPAVLLLRDRFCEPMAIFLKHNIFEQLSGNWEIDIAIKVLIKISQECYDYEKLTCLLNLVIEFYSSKENRREDRIYKNARDKLERNIFNFQNIQHIKDYFVNHLCSLDMDYKLQLLYRFCFHCKLALTMQGNELRIRGRVHANLTLPDNDIIKKIIRATLETCRTHGKGEIASESEEQIVVKNYRSFLISRGGCYPTIFESPDKLKILSQLSSVLPPPIEIEEKLEKDFKEIEEDYKKNSLPEKCEDLFGYTLRDQVAVLRVFDRPLYFVDKHLKMRALVYKNTPSVWKDEAGINSTVFLGNYFGEGAYKYLKCGYEFSDECKPLIKKVLEEFMADNLSESTAIEFFLKATLMVDITADNEFKNNLIKKLQGIEEQEALIQAFSHCSQDSELTDKERENLELLMSHWPEATPALTQFAASASVTDTEIPRTATRKRKSGEELPNPPKRPRVAKSPLQRNSVLAKRDNAATQPVVSALVIPEGAPTANPTRKRKSTEELTADNRLSEDFVVTGEEGTKHRKLK